jgi:pimeloyl-ACP methyl ester carboxylesterase
MSETPHWFWEAIETEPESQFVDVKDCDIHYQRWGSSGKPGLLFVHGHHAHGHWWDFIAPAFLEDYQVAALDLSGMGDSDFRDEYSVDLFAEEILTVADAAGLDDQTVLVAHSFGGQMAQRAAVLRPERLKGLVLVDSGVRRPGGERPRGVERWIKPKVYPDFDTAKERFRLQPPQTCDNHYIVDYIARKSIERTSEGWVWKFDEELDNRMKYSGGSREEDFKKTQIRIAEIWGEQSRYFSRDNAEYMLELRPDLNLVRMANAQHHLFLDQPLLFIDELKRILATWN